MAQIERILRLVAVAALGTFFGAMLTEAGVLVPFWRSVDPEAFLEWYAGNAARLLGYFGPVTAVAGVAALASALVSAWQRGPGWVPSAAAAVAMLATVLMFPAYFEAANASFADGSLAAAMVPAELATWAAWHHARTLLAGVALGLAVLGLGGSER